MVLNAIERFRDAAETINRGIVDHGANQSVFLDGGKIHRIQKVNRDEAHILAGGAKVIQFDFGLAPAADAVVNIALEFGGRSGFSPGRF